MLNCQTYRLFGDAVGKINIYLHRNFMESNKKINKRHVKIDKIHTNYKIYKTSCHHEYSVRILFLQLFVEELCFFDLLIMQILR